MIIPLLGCVLITAEDYEERISWNATPDSGETGEPGPTLGVTGNLEIPDQVQLDHDAATVGLLNFVFVEDADTGQVVQLGDVVGAGEATQLEQGTERPYSFDVPLQPQEHHYSDGERGEEHALYLIGAWVDEGDGVPGAGDTFVGASTTQFLAHVRGTVTPEFWTEGDGWYLITFSSFTSGGLDDLLPVNQDFAVLDVQANLLLNRLHLAPYNGFVTGDQPARPMVTMVHLSAIESIVQGDDPEFTPALDAVVVESVGDQQGFRYPDGVGMPPADAVRSALTFEGESLDYSGAALELAWYVGIAFHDSNSDQDWTYGGPQTEWPYADSVSNNDQATFLMWYQPTGLEAAFAVAQGVSMGWNAMDTEFKPKAWVSPMILNPGE